ncbi:hypothetical protein SAMN05216551_102273 [Chitinasiproducens palmae]|uniref:Uncharacterized protein n=1 Tax=Chitinasiproducens palmae TaxID=1770053 RepID=A0A1H2PKZ7_9BURK|nr:hypothetical protein SAMN05216551_102273 [Chitinasiproducens palmae]
MLGRSIIRRRDAGARGAPAAPDHRAARRGSPCEYALRMQIALRLVQRANAELFARFGPLPLPDDLQRLTDRQYRDMRALQPDPPHARHSWSSDAIARLSYPSRFPAALVRVAAWTQRSLQQIFDPAPSRAGGVIDGATAAPDGAPRQRASDARPTLRTASSTSATQLASRATHANKTISRLRSTVTAPAHPSARRPPRPCAIIAREKVRRCLGRPALEAPSLRRAGHPGFPASAAVVPLSCRCRAAVAPLPCR